jgi:hypothetical protein
VRALAVSHVVSQMSTGAAAVGIAAALAIGWYVSKWHTAELDEISARRRLANAVKVMWAGRRALLVVVILGVVLVDLWFRGKGR